VKGHVPEKDGILAWLLMAELVATEKKSLGQILKQLEKHTGEFHTDRLNVKIPAEKKDALLAKLSAGFDSIGPFQSAEIHYHRRLQIFVAGWRMGGVPRQRDRALDPLLHRG